MPNGSFFLGLWPNDLGYIYSMGILDRPALPIEASWLVSSLYSSEGTVKPDLYLHELEECQHQCHLHDGAID